MGIGQNLAATWHTPANLVNVYFKWTSQESETFSTLKSHMKKLSFCVVQKCTLERKFSSCPIQKYTSKVFLDRVVFTQKCTMDQITYFKVKNKYCVPKTITKSYLYIKRFYIFLSSLVFSQIISRQPNFYCLVSALFLIKIDKLRSSRPLNVDSTI